MPLPAVGSLFLDEVATYIAAQSAGDAAPLVWGTNLYASVLPDTDAAGAATPDRCVALYEYGGAAETYTMGPATLPAWGSPHLQVVTRDVNYVGSRGLAQQLWKLLQQANLTVAGTLWLRIEPLGQPYLLERDVKNRVLCVANYEVNRVQT